MNSAHMSKQHGSSNKADKNKLKKSSKLSVSDRKLGRGTSNKKPAQTLRRDRESAQPKFDASELDTYLKSMVNKKAARKQFYEEKAKLIKEIDNNNKKKAKPVFDTSEIEAEKKENSKEKIMKVSVFKNTEVANAGPNEDITVIISEL